MAELLVKWLASGTPEDDTVLAYAAKELAHYASALTATQYGTKKGLTARGGGAAVLGLCDSLALPVAVSLSRAPWDDGYCVWAVDGRLFVAGRNARSVLFGVYDFLEKQGVRFVRPGDDGEVMPRRDSLILPDAPMVEEPKYRHRGVCIEGAPSLKHAVNMVDWCAKKRMNTVFLQFFSSRYFYSLWSERPYNPKQAGTPLTDEQALAMDDQVIAAMKQRGMVFHRVGHSWTSAAFDMPRSGWVKADEAEVKPELRRYIAEVNGERKLFGGVPINTEICYSHGPAFDRFVDNIVSYSQAHPEMDVVHVWLSDATNNKCECAECRELHISDWYVKVINRLSEELAERAPNTRFVFLCYFELWWPPQKVAIDQSRGNAIMMYAPITRCYGHSLGDADCDDGEEWPRPALNQFAVSMQNAFFADSLSQWRQAFPGDSFDFDYHLMWAVWRQMTDTVLGRVLHEDLQQLKDMGLDGIVSCQSFRIFYPSGLAMTALTEGLWDPSVAWEPFRERYLEDAFGEHAAFADHYLTRVEGLLFSGDDHWRSRPFSTADAKQLKQGIAFLRASMAEAEQRATGADSVRGRSLSILAHHARLLQYVVRSYQARLSGDTAAANRHLDRARDFLQRTEPRFSPYIDTFLALTNSVEAHRPL
ncbi:MAG: DUF4838 domain-containing protein [Anaerolineae bacterium]